MTELNTEEKILETAKKIFFQKGFDGTRMEDIATAAQINKALLHYYFRSKENLFSKIFDTYASQILPNITAVLEKEGNIFDKLEMLIHHYVDYISTNPQLPIFVLTEINKNPEKVVEMLRKSDSFPKMQQFIGQLIMEIQIGNVKPISPIHLILNIMSMTIFPFVAKPMFMNMLKLSEDDFKIIISQRKKEITQFVFSAIRP